MNTPKRPRNGQVCLEFSMDDTRIELKLTLDEVELSPP